MVRLRGMIVGALALALLLPAVAAAAVGAPDGFRVRASNGFVVRVLATPAQAGSPGSVLVLVTRPGESVLYVAPATVGEDTIEAKLGAIGRVDVRYAPDGGTGRESSPCDKRKLAYDSGYYQGTIELHGEEGYTKLEATRARGEVGFLLSLVCAKNVNEGIGGHSPGARLIAHRRFAGGYAELEARINSPTRPSRFEASIAETHGRLRVFRSVRAVGPPAAFRFDVPAGAATLAPPLPFAGVGRFERRASGPGRLLGNLAVDFPGHSDLDLAGPGTRAGLERHADSDTE